MRMCPLSASQENTYHFGSGGTTLLLQQFLDPLDGFLPAHVLLDCQALERFGRGFGGPLCFQVGLEDVDVVIEPFQILIFDSGDSLQHLAGVNHGLGIGERV